MTTWAQYPVTHGYTMSYEGPGTDTPHPAIDIGTPFHTPLTAPLAGTVKKADYQPWGGEIYIQPDNPLYPEYLFFHPDQLEVTVGQHVSAGQEIALSGGENPGYPGALHPASSQYSTGAHTHIQYVTQLDYYTPDGRDIPYGPDPSNLLALARGTQSSGPVTSGTPLSDTSSSTISKSSFLRIGIGLLGVGAIVVGIVTIARTFVTPEQQRKIAKVVTML